MSSFYSESELESLGLDDYGDNVKISKKASLYSPETITIGDNIRIDDFCLLSGDITLGSHIHLAPFCGLWGQHGIRIGDFSGLSSRVSIYSSRADFSGGSLTNPTVPDSYRPGNITGEVNLGEHVVVGASSVILPDATIETGAVVGALSLVRDGTIPAWEIHFGTPTRCIQERDREAIRELEAAFLDEYEDGQ